MNMTNFDVNLRFREDFCLNIVIVDVLSIIEQAFIDRRQLKERITSENAIYDIFASINITQSNQHCL